MFVKGADDLVDVSGAVSLSCSWEGFELPP
jgi:hypothetical protein